MAEDNEKKLLKETLKQKKNALSAFKLAHPNKKAWNDEQRKEFVSLRQEIEDIKFRLGNFGITFDQKLVDDHVILSVRHLKQFFRSGEYKTKAVHDVS